MTHIIKRLCCSLLFFAAVTAALLLAQSSTTPAQTLTYTIDSAPESLVYKFFFGELAAFHAKADELTAQGKDVSAMRIHFKRLTALNSADYEVLRSQASEAVAAAQAGSSAAGLLLKGAATRADFQKAAPELDRIRTAVESARQTAVDKLRERLGPEQFTQLDRRIREYVVPNIRLRSLTPNLQGSLREGK